MREIREGDRYHTCDVCNRKFKCGRKELNLTIRSSCTGNAIDTITFYCQCIRNNYEVIDISNLNSRTILSVDKYICDNCVLYLGLKFEARFNPVKIIKGVIRPKASASCASEDKEYCIIKFTNQK